MITISFTNPNGLTLNPPYVSIIESQLKITLFLFLILLNTLRGIRFTSAPVSNLNFTL